MVQRNNRNSVVYSNFGCQMKFDLRMVSTNNKTIPWKTV